MGILLCALSPFFVYGQLLDPVDYAIIESPDTVKAGEQFSIIVEATIDDNWHLYSILNDPDAGPFPTQFTSPSNGMTIVGEVSETEATIAYDPNFDTDLGWHSNKAQFEIPIKFDGQDRGIQPIVLEVLYQVCDDRSCLPPKTKQIEGEVILAGVSGSFEEEDFFRDESTPFWPTKFILLLVVSLVIFFSYRLIRRKVL